MMKNYGDRLASTRLDRNALRRADCMQPRWERVLGPDSGSVGERRAGLLEQHKRKRRFVAAVADTEGGGRTRDKTSGLGAEHKALSWGPGRIAFSSRPSLLFSLSCDLSSLALFLIRHRNAVGCSDLPAGDTARRGEAGGSRQGGKVGG